MISGENRTLVWGKHFKSVRNVMICRENSKFLPGGVGRVYFKIHKLLICRENGDPRLLGGLQGGNVGVGVFVGHAISKLVISVF